MPDGKHPHLKYFPRRSLTSINHLIGEMTTLMLAEFNAKTRFLLRAEFRQGKSAHGIQLLHKAKGEP